MTQANRWGIVATIKAPTASILEFVAYHLDLGADHIYICLDDTNTAAFDVLKPHPQVTCTINDRAFWIEKHGRQPVKHQVRQVRNASRVYRKAKDIDWLFHIDVDEFLCPDDLLGDSLAAVPDATQVLQIPPCESLCVEERPDLDPGPTLCKARPSDRKLEQKLQSELYPNYHGLLANGFISHTQGKLGLRTGHKDIRFAIHRAFQNDEDTLKSERATQIELCHRHVESWDKWLKIMEFRLTKGSYREELTHNQRQGGSLTFHQLFSGLTADGTTELRAFFEEVCLATPELCARLEKHGLLRQYALDLIEKRKRHFPDFQV